MIFSSFCVANDFVSSLSSFNDFILSLYVSNYFISSLCIASDFVYIFISLNNYVSLLSVSKYFVSSPWTILFHHLISGIILFNYHMLPIMLPILFPMAWSAESQVSLGQVRSWSLLLHLWGLSLAKILFPFLARSWKPSSRGTYPRFQRLHSIVASYQEGEGGSMYGFSFLVLRYCHFKKYSLTIL